MNYLKQIRAFADYLLYNERLSTGQITLWYALMTINNKAHWSEWFTAANLTLESLTGLSRQGISKARNSLRQLNLIDFKSNGTKATSYHVAQLYEESTTMSDSLQDSLQDGSQVVDKLVAPQLQESSTLIKHKHKQKRKQEKKSSKKPAPVRHEYGEYKNVLLTDTDFDKLKNEFPKDWQERLNNLSEYMESSGKHYKNHLATIRNWARRDNNKVTAGSNGRRSFESSTVNDSFDDDDLPF